MCNLVSDMKFKNIVKLKRITKVNKLGDKLLILATAPEVKAFFDNERVREYFRNYDVAVINKMPLCSEKEMHLIKPRYMFFLDDIFYADSWEGKPNERKQWVEDVLGRVDWKCSVVVPCLASFNVDNENIDYIYLNIFSAPYNRFTKTMYKKNLLNPGYNTVTFGALFFGVTFGYETIGLLGFAYRVPYGYMDEDGYHYDGYTHYYETEPKHYVLKNEDIVVNGESLKLRLAKRAVESQTIMSYVMKYANDMNVHVTNYTPYSDVDMFEYKDINKCIERLQ